MDTLIPRLEKKEYGSYGPFSVNAAQYRQQSEKSLKISRPFEFVELMGRSHFSFLQGASSPEEMILQALRLGYRGLALSDLNGLYGVVKADQALKSPSLFTAHEDLDREGFQFSIGSELSFGEQEQIHLLPMNKNGYKNLCQLITQSRLGVPKTHSRLSLGQIEELSDDLIAFYNPPFQVSTLSLLKQIFNERLYLPVWRDLTWESVTSYRQALDIEKDWGLPLFVTQRPLMHHPNRKPLFDVLTCILHKTTLSQAKNRLLQNSERSLKPLNELGKLWKDRPDLLKRSLEISRQLQFSLSELQYDYPRAVVPEELSSSEYLKQLTFEGIKKRYPKGATKKVIATLEKELELVKELEYEDYFLTLWDVCQFAKKRGILHQGRGSAANSIICFSLELTAVDPTEVDLLFERFLSKERGEPPDIDIDFESGRREEVLQYVYKKYTPQHAAMVCTLICYRSRMAFRETAKTFGLPLNSINQIIKYMGREGLNLVIEKMSHENPWGIEPETFQMILKLSTELYGFPRHLGIHTGGFLVTRSLITDCVPIEQASMANRYVIQWNKDDLNYLKMMKIDFLGLGMLTALQKSFEMLKERKKIKLCLASLPQDDKKTYDMIQKADTVGVFQIESRAQMSLLPRLRPKNYYDLVVEVAIVRPGPLQGGMVHPYIRRRHGLEPIHYAHPALEPILKKTFGVPIFQEQIMQVASTVCGFTAGEADELRRMMSSSWKDPEAMKGLKNRLIQGMLQKGIDKKYADQIYQTIIGFASYGFPESHAASFAHLTYASSFMKCHHPEVFTAALLNSQPMGFYSPRALIADAQRHGVHFLPIDVQKSNRDCELEERPDKKFAVRLGLATLYGLQASCIDEILIDRKQFGSYRTLEDFALRSKLSHSALMSLAACGALQSFGFQPRELLWRIQALNLNPQALRPMPKKQQSTQSQKLTLKQDDEALMIKKLKIPDESTWEVMQREYQWQGFSLDYHPLGLIRPQLDQVKKNQRVKKLKLYPKAEQFESFRNGDSIQIVGLLSLTQKPPTAKGFCFLTLEDETGHMNIILKPGLYKIHRLTIRNSPLLEIRGKLQKQEGVINIQAEKIKEYRINQGSLNK